MKQLACGFLLGILVFAAAYCWWWDYLATATEMAVQERDQYWEAHLQQKVAEERAACALILEQERSDCTERLKAGQKAIQVIFPITVTTKTRDTEVETQEKQRVEPPVRSTPKQLLLTVYVTGMIVLVLLIALFLMRSWQRQALSRFRL